MNKIIAWSCGVVIVFAMVAASMSAHANTTIRTEAVQALEESIHDTVSVLMEREEFTMENNQQFIVAFLEGLLQRIESDSEIRVEILGADYQKGLLSVRVIEVFQQLGGREQMISSNCTVIFDRKQNPIFEEDTNQFATVTFYYDRDSAFGNDDSWENKIYKQYVLKKGSTITFPINPIALSENLEFQAWENKETQEQQEGELFVDQDFVFYGIWEEP